MIIISNGTGTGQPKNPYDNSIHPMALLSDDPQESVDYVNDLIVKMDEFDRLNPPLPIFKDNKPYMEVGEVECEVVDQVKFRRLDKWRDFEYGETHEKFNQDDRETRQVYRVLPSESERKEIKTQNMKTEVEEQSEWLWYAKFDELGWGLAPGGGKIASQALYLATKADPPFEILFTNNIELYKK